MKSWPIVVCEELYFIAVQHGNVVKILKATRDGDELYEQEGDEYEGDESGEQEGDEYEEDESDEQKGDEYEGDEPGEQEGDEYDGDESDEQEGDEFNETEVHKFINVNDMQYVNRCLLIQYDNVHYSLIESKIWHFHDIENMRITKEINPLFMFTPKNPIRVSDDLHYYIVGNNRVRSFLLDE